MIKTNRSKHGYWGSLNLEGAEKARGEVFHGICFRIGVVMFGGNTDHNSVQLFPP